MRLYIIGKLGSYYMCHILFTNWEMYFMPYLLDIIVFDNTLKTK